MTTTWRETHNDEWTAHLSAYSLLVFTPPSGEPESQAWEWAICGQREWGIADTAEEAKQAAKEAVTKKLEATLMEARSL
jgi:hypothetical protein